MNLFRNLLFWIVLALLAAAYLALLRIVAAEPDIARTLAPPPGAAPAFASSTDDAKQPVTLP